MSQPFGSKAFVAFAVIAVPYSLVFLAAAFVGIDEAIGGFWASVVMAACVFTGFVLPLAAGAFWGAMTSWGWPWYAALAFAFPALVAGVLMLTSGAWGLVVSKFKKKPNSWKGDQ